MNKGGRPPKVNIEKLIKDAYTYADETPLPIVAEFAHMHDITREYLYQLANAQKEKGDNRLSHAIKRIAEAKAIKLEKGALIGKFSPSMAIFSLKQLGWSDTPKEDKDNSEKVVIVDDFTD